MSFDDEEEVRSRDLHGECRREIDELRIRAAIVEAERDIAAAAYHALREGYIDTDREATLRARAERAEEQRDRLKAWVVDNCRPRMCGCYEEPDAPCACGARAALADERTGGEG
jgi:hypothetical protein